MESLKTRVIVLQSCKVRSSLQEELGAVSVAGRHGYWLGAHLCCVINHAFGIVFAA